MTICNIIVDSCSYFRLAQSISPLLKTPFGKQGYCLGVIKELDKEFGKNPNLKNKFFWVSQKEYVDNRDGCFSPTRDQLSEINIAFYFIRDSARENQFTVSEVDIIGLSYAYILKMPIITDDFDMLKLAKEYGIHTYKTLALMKLMLDSGLITKEKIRSIVSYWAYENDEPKDFRKDFKRLFSEDPPE